MAKPVILLVDDEVDLLQGTAAAVRHALPQYEVLEAATVEEAEEFLLDLEAADEHLALAVVDHILGGATGMGLIEVLRERFPNAPLMLFTGRATPAVEDEARAHGVRVMWKPVRLRQLLGEMTELLRSGQRSEPARA